MYSLAGWRFVLPAVYAPAWADSRSGFMSWCLYIHWPGGAGYTIGIVSYNSRGDALTTVYGFLRGLLFAISATMQCKFKLDDFRSLNHFARRYSTARLRILLRVAYVSPTVMQLHLSQNCILSSTRGTIPHIIPNYPRAHYNAGLNTSAAVCRRRYLVSVRNLSIRCACNQTRVCRRKCSGRRLPNESVPTEVF